MVTTEFEAGPDQTLVIYTPQDVGAELEPLAIFQEIAADASRRAADHMRISSMTSMALRHGGTFMHTGGGYQTSVAVAVVYERVSRAPG